MATRKLVCECKKCGYENKISIKVEYCLTHTNKRPYPRRRKYIGSDNG